MPPAKSDIPSVCGILFFMRPLLSIAELNQKKPDKTLLTAISFCGVKEQSGSKRRLVLCNCLCGGNRICLAKEFLNGHVFTCGCIKPANKTHGLTKSPLYTVWMGMRNRCQQKSQPSYKDYGARGIMVCKKWDTNFLTFYNWAINNGWQKGLQLDRRKNDGNYSPSNCRFVTPIINASNKRGSIRITYKGKTRSVREWSELLGLYPSLIVYRYRKGWAIRDVLKPVKKQKLY